MDVDLTHDELDRWCAVHQLILKEISGSDTYVMVYLEKGWTVISGFRYKDCPSLLRIINERDAQSLHSGYLRLPLAVFVDRVKSWRKQHK